MNEEDWGEIVSIIQDELADIGLSDIADLNHYEIREGPDRYFPNSRSLVKLMLVALDRELSVRSPITIEQSLMEIREVIDEGEKPTAAIVWTDSDRSIIEGREMEHKLDGDERIPEAIIVLGVLISELLTIGSTNGDF